MSDEKHWVDNEHYRKVSDDGQTSWLYEADSSFLGTDRCIEIARHHDDGTTTAYEVDHSFLGSLFGDGRGREK
ncbi:MAG: hypothetical protein M5U13_15760 [Thermoanaerobaculia bacterium]|nr:hypothetical protein [Thermoanaerobaculia bacterium]